MLSKQIPTVRFLRLVKKLSYAYVCAHLPVSSLLDGRTQQEMKKKKRGCNSVPTETPGEGKGKSPRVGVSSQGKTTPMQGSKSITQTGYSTWALSQHQIHSHKTLVTWAGTT